MRRQTVLQLAVRAGLRDAALQNRLAAYQAQQTLIYEFQPWYLDCQLSRFDLDGDGMSGGVELTAEQAEAMRRVVADTVRTFALFVGLFFSFFLSVAF